MKTHSSPISQKKALGYALRPYKLWDDWIKSPARPFTKRELDLIEMYRVTNSYAACSERLLITMADAAKGITSIIIRLKLQLEEYKKWESGQRSLYEALSIFDLESLQDLKAITINDLKLIIGEPFYCAHSRVDRPP